MFLNKFFTNNFLNVTLAQIVISILLAIIIIGSLENMEKQYHYWYSNPSDWFQVYQLEAYHETVYGKDTILVYDRVIKKDFYAHWIVNIQKLDTTNVSGENSFSYFCKGEGNQQYKKGVKKPENAVSVVWLTYDSPECKNLKTTPGFYRIVVSWILDRGPEYYPVTVEAISNVFRILDKNEKLQDLPVPVPRFAPGGSDK